MDPVATHARILDHFRATVAAVANDQWDNPTNCTPWAASTLVNHALASQLLWVQAVTGEPLVDMSAVMAPTPLEGDALAKTDEVIALAKSTWLGEGLMDTEIAGPFGTLPGRATIVFPSIDALAHSWDLATSVGLDAELDDDLLAVGEALTAAAVNDTTRGFGIFGAEATCGPDASATDRLMAKSGRSRQ